MILRLCILAPLTLSLAACSALDTQISRQVEPQVSTEVAAQVGTALAGTSTPAPQPTVASTEAPRSSPSYDCGKKYCKNMTECAEAVYKLVMCGHGRLDSDDDGIPCESMCKNANVDAIKAKLAGEQPPESDAPSERTGSLDSAAEVGTVTRVIDGDTIDVRLGDATVRIRYLQINTPERAEPCYREATQANADLVAGKTVRLVRGKRLVDRYGRLLRYVHVGDVMVERVLVERGFAEVVLYPPDDTYYDEFLRLEREAAAAGRGCHPTGIFADGSTTR